MPPAAARRFSAVFFDLDGTLLDTAADVAAACNALRGEYGLEPVPEIEYRSQVSHGSVAVVRLAFGALPEAEFEQRRARFFELYLAGIARRTRLFAGLDAVLQHLEACAVPWGVVTNKPGFLTDPLLRQLGLAARAACVVAGDSLPERKPHPRPLLVAAALVDLPPGDCMYVGDAERDIVAARAAGMYSVLAKFGYLGADDRPEQWRADDSIDHPLELLRWFPPQEHAS